MQGFGACKPSLCDWGSVPGVVYADRVRNGSAVAFRAEFVPRFGKQHLAGRLQGQFLAADIFTEFTDGSGRSNFHIADRMVKQ